MISHVGEYTINGPMDALWVIRKSGRSGILMLKTELLSYQIN